MHIPVKYLFVLFPSEGKCVSVCPEGYYGDEDTNDCEDCHLDCVSCSGPGRDDCVLCRDGATLENGQCVTDDDDDVCPVLTFRSGENNNSTVSCPKLIKDFSLRTQSAQLNLRQKDLIVWVDYLGVVARL